MWTCKTSCGLVELLCPHVPHSFSLLVICSSMPFPFNMSKGSNPNIKHAEITYHFPDKEPHRHGDKVALESSLHHAYMIFTI